MEQDPVKACSNRKASEVEEVATDLLHHLAIHAKDVPAVLAHHVFRPPWLIGIVSLKALMGELEVGKGAPAWMRSAYSLALSKSLP